MTLALLITAVTGAWATDPNTVIWNGNGATWNGWDKSETTHTVGDITITCSGNAKAYENIMASGHPLSMEAGDDAITFTSNGAPFTSIKIKMYDGTDPGLVGWTWDNGYNIEWSGTPSTSVTLSGCNIKADKITFTFGSAEPDIEVKWNASTKTGTFVMPAFGVEIDPIYAPVAQWAKVENVDQIPTAIDGIIAGEAKDIVKAGTVAKVGSTENAQGTLMYLVTTTKEQPTSTTGFSATVPTGATLTGSYAEDQTVYVWYYIAGANTPDGQTPTAENTFNDSEICATPLTVTLKANQFNLTFSPAPVSNATVTVGGTAATAEQLNTGKIEKVGTGTEIKLKAATGYKFRKVEVKKGDAAKTITIGDVELTYADGDTWETIVSKNSDKIKIRAGGYIAQVAQPAPNQFRYLKVVLSTNKVNPSDIIDPSKNYQWGTMEVAW